MYVLMALRLILTYKLPLCSARVAAAAAGVCTTYFWVMCIFCDAEA